MVVMNLFQALGDNFRSLPSTYEFKLKVNINVKWLHLFKLGYIIVLAVILFLVYFTGGWNYKETGVSSLVIKVMGSDLSDGEIWDAVDYVYPPQEVKAFFITTRAAITKQIQKTCPDKDKRSKCVVDSDCLKNRHTDYGIQTGECDGGSGMCIIHAWCPMENQHSNRTKIIYIKSASNFTVYVRNHEEFIKFNISKSNDPNSKRSSTKCLYNTITNKLCPTFKIEDILTASNVRFDDVKEKGGIFQFYIKWHCYFNWNSAPCNPVYLFKRIAKDNSGKFSGYRMRYAIYQNYNGVRHRELVTVYGLRFLIMIKSVGEQFRIISFLSNVGSYLSYFGIWTFITGVLCAMFLLDKKDLLKLDETDLVRLLRERDGLDIAEDTSVIKESTNKDISNEQNIALIPV